MRNHLSLRDIVAVTRPWAMMATSELDHSHRPLMHAFGFGQSSRSSQPRVHVFVFGWQAPSPTPQPQEPALEHGLFSMASTNAAQDVIGVGAHTLTISPSTDFMLFKACVVGRSQVARARGSKQRPPSSFRAMPEVI